MHTPVKIFSKSAHPMQPLEGKSLKQGGILRKNNIKNSLIIEENPVLLGFPSVSKDTYKYGGEMGIRTPETALTVYTISSRAPSASSDISPN